MRSIFVKVAAMVLLLGLVITGVGVSSVRESQAQDGESCVQLAAEALAEAQQACVDLGRGEVCYGHAGVAATLLSGGAASLSTTGDKLLVNDIENLITSAADLNTGEWGVAVLELPAGLAEESVHAVLFGDVAITRPTLTVSDHPTLAVFNRGGSPVNVRNGAAITYDVVGQLAAGEEAAADGRNEQGDWLRIQYSGGIAWVFTPLIGWDGDQSAVEPLQVLLPNDVTPVAQASEPFQSFTFAAGQPVCDAVPSGMLLQYTGEQAASVQINQVSLDFSDSTLLLTSNTNGELEIKVLAGSARITARGVPQDAEAGEVVGVSLGGEDGLTPLTAPQLQGDYAFSETAYAPIDLLPGKTACIVGLPTAEKRIVLRVGPGTQRGELGNMQDTGYSVLGWANDPDGSPWWQLDTGEQSSWVAQADVHTIGLCNEVAQVEAPPLVVAPPVVPAGENPVAGGTDFAPTANSVWQMIPGSDNMIGECTGAPAINFCDHLAAIGPTAGGVSWRGMEPNPYSMVRTQTNTYVYSGPNGTGTGTLSMILSFNSETSLNMTMSLVLSSEPNCQHVYYYSGTKNW
ncbi:MAG: SH3 domain-containing protein [Chloroflexi bacterium]|nr:SH3 domain-containing protein [Chloroflexota bacterium]